MIKKSFRLMLLAAFALSSVMFVSCNKWEDEINELDEKVASLEQTVQNLQSAISGGAVVTGVTSGTDGVTFTMSNGQSYTVKHGNNGKDGVNGTNGTNGTNGVDGKTPVITIDPETNNWVIDGVDTGICAKGVKGDKGDKGDKGETGAAGTNGTNGTNGKDGVNGKDGKSPYINEETGNWMVWDAEAEEFVDTQKSAIGAQTFVVEYSSYYELNVMDAETNEFTTVKLPKTGVITSIEIFETLADNGVYTLNLNYGKLNKNVTFNGKPYAKNSYLIPTGTSFQAMINPLNAKATKYDFALMNTQGGKPYVVTASQNTSDSPLTTKADDNLGIWNMNVKFAGNPGATAGRLYALATETLNGTVASKYELKVVENKVSAITEVSLSDLSRAYNKEINLANCFIGDTDYAGVIEDKTIAKVDGVEKSNLTPYLIGYYFEIVDELRAADYGVKLNGNKLTAEKPVDDFKIAVNFLLADCNGTKFEGEDAEIINVDFTYVPTTAETGSVSWTINHTSKNVYLPLGDLQSLLRGETENELPSIAAVTYKRTASKNLDASGYQVTVNGTKYGYGADADNKFANNDMTKWIAAIDTDALYYKKSNGTYAKVLDNNGDNVVKIQTPMYVKFTFDETQAFPGDYVVMLSMNKGGLNNSSADDATYTLPVNVSIVDPVFNIVKHENYFSGNKATVYGTPGANDVVYDLLDLFKTEDDVVREGNLTFTEEITMWSNGKGWYDAWLEGYGWKVDSSTGTIELDTPATGSEITVPLYNSIHLYDNVYDNIPTVGATRNFTAVLAPYGNNKITKVTYDFSVTTKSAIAAGTFKSNAKVTIDSNEPAYFFGSDFTGVDVYNNKFYITHRFIYDEDGNYTGYTPDGCDRRITDITIEPANDAAADYLVIQDRFDLDLDTVKAIKADSDGFKVQRSSSLQRLVKDTDCKINVTITDAWGYQSTATVTVTLKAFGN